MYQYKIPSFKLIMVIYGGLNCTFVSAAQSNSAFIITGPAMTNEYIGSKDRKTVPMVISQFQLGQHDIDIEGLSVRASIIKLNSWDLGIAGSLDFGRDEEVSNKKIADFKPIDSNVNLGLYLSNSLNDQWLEQDQLAFRVSATKDMSDVHQGVLTTFTTSYTLPLYLPWRFEFEIEATHGDSNYMNSYFGVSSFDAGSSGMAQYNAGRGFRDISFNSNIGLFFSPDWGVFMRLSYSRLLNDAADSPIVLHEGSANQSLIGLGLFHRF